MSEPPAVCLPAALLALALAPVAPQAGESPRFYDRQAEGWFWYQRDPLAALPAEPEPPSTPAPPTPEPPATAASAPPDPAPLSAAWLRANLEHYRLQAIDDPTPTKVALYLYLQKLALDKASRFTETFQQVVQSDPYLDETTRRPVGTYANLLNRVAGEQRGCSCAHSPATSGSGSSIAPTVRTRTAQAPVLARLAHRLGLTVQAIALDGQPLPTGHFPDFRADAGQAARLGVVSTPALFLVRPPDGLAPLAQGLLSLSDLEQRLLLAAHTAGWIEAADYARTRPLVTDLRLAPASEHFTEIPADPETFLARLRHHAQDRDPDPRHARHHSTHGP
ncbi:MAG: conjugal transfer protein TraF [Chromatiales bacterium]|nr:conjugal transfer protein TraF [Chromatiales bacterium]